MIHYLFAHAGEVHETATEAAQHMNEGTTLSSATIFWLILIIAPIVLLAIAQLLKLQLTTQMLVISTFLIVFSVASYQNPGAYSVISLVGGFATVFFLTIVGLTSAD